MNAAVLSDNELVNLYVNGNEDALKALIARHEKKVFSYIFLSVKDKELAEDIFQGVYDFNECLLEYVLSKFLVFYRQKNVREHFLFVTCH